MAEKAKGSGARKTTSWIEGFVQFTNNLDSPMLFRKWAAISTIACALEQKTWLMTSSRIYPNLFVFLVGPPATGKTRAIRVMQEMLASLPDHHFAPTSLTSASLIDSLKEAKRTIIIPGDMPIEYNAMTIAVDEMGTFISEYAKEMIANLSAFYDPVPYGHNRRGREIKISIKSPQVNILCGTTPVNLMEFMPQGAWEQGFTSRLMLIYADEKIIGNDFTSTRRDLDKDLVIDLAAINQLMGEFKVTEEYKNAVQTWRKAGESVPDFPAPTHPKLLHYNGRRRVHLYKLSMVAAIDKANTLILDKAAFNTAFGWLMEAEQFMPDVFRTGSVGGDSRITEEIRHFVETASKNGTVAVPEHLIVRFASERVPTHTVLRILEVMERSKMLFPWGADPRSLAPLYNVIPRRHSLD